MPLKSKKSQAAKQREAKKAQALLSDDPTSEVEYNSYQHQYRPSNPELQPYWDEFYENPYPNEQECCRIAERLGSTFSTIERWFEMARRYTHTPDKKPDNDIETVEEPQVEQEVEDESAILNWGEASIEGTLYEHFYSIIRTQKQGVKRGRSDTVTENKPVSRTQDPEPKRTKIKAHQRGPRGPYTKDSRTTDWRNRSHAQKYASDIRKFFPIVGGQTDAKPPSPEVIIIENESDTEVKPPDVDKNSPSTHEEPFWADAGASGMADSFVIMADGLQEVAGDALSRAQKVEKSVLGELMTIEEFKGALDLLEASMNELKLDVQTPQLSSLETANNSELDTPEDKEPTIEDAEIEIRESSAQLHDRDEEGDVPFYSTLDRHLQRLLNEQKKAKSPNVKKLLELTALSDYNNLREAYRNAGNRAPSTQASNKIAEAKFAPTAKKLAYQQESWYARHLRAKANHLVRFGCLPVTKQGQGATHYSLLDQEDIRLDIKSYLRTINVGTVTPARLRRVVNQKILPELGIGSPICEKTARRWIDKLGYRPVEHRKGVYMDGHERSDVVEHRKQFLEIIKRLSPLIQQYDDKTDEALPLVLPPGQKQHVPVAHDECCFHANDREKVTYLREGEQQLRQKGKGRTIHVSGFITETVGRLALPPEMVEENKKLPPGERLLITDAQKIIEPGKNRDKWWDMEQLCEQLVDAIKIFDRLHPQCVGVFLFDQSSAHGAFSDDALVVGRMNVTPGGKSAKVMHATVIPMDNPHPHLRGKPQSMVFEDGHPMAGQPKGMRAVLEERGLLGILDAGRNGQPVGKCKECQKSDEARAKAEKEARERMEEDPDFFRTLEDVGLDEDLPQRQTRSTTCCMHRCLSLQQDFLDEKPKIQLIIERAGHICLFLPKFHCELNPIEMYWGYAKRLFREQANGTITKARELVPECLDACKTQTIRHFWRKSWRYMDAYMVGLTGKDAEYAVKKYKSHRRVTQVLDVS